MITLLFPFAPVPKGRPRFGRIGKHMRVYTPMKTRRYESDLKLWASKQMQGKKPLEGALSVRAHFFLERPKSVKRQLPTVKPDLDNFLKCLDALNGICWADDAQIVRMEAAKQYAMDDAGARISILITEVTA